MATLTDRGIRAMKARAKPYLAPDGDGLYLRVQPGGGRSWVARLYRGGKARDMGLGPYPEIPLAAAREAALEARRAALRGDDPIASRQRVKAVPSFQDAAEAYIAGNRAGWRNDKHGGQWSATLATYAYPVIGAMRVNAIETADVLRVLQPIWASKPETASRVRGRIEAVLTQEHALGHRGRENPAAWKGNLAAILPAKEKTKAAVRRETGREEHHAAMAYADLPAFLVNLRQRDGLAARALEFTILTASRTNETIGATWAEIDLEARLWTIPASRMKATRDRRTPLSEAAARLLAALPGNRDDGRKDSGSLREAHRGGKVFPLSNMAMSMLLRRMKRDDATVHGFRSAFKDWATEQTSFSAEASEMALAHAVGNKVEAAYRRGDLFAKRRDLAEAWARFCDGTSAEVIPLRPAV